MGSRLVHSKKVRGGGRAPPTAQPPPPVTIFHPNTPKTCSFLPKPSIFYPTTPKPLRFPPKPTARPPPPHLSPFQNGDGFVDTDAKLQRIVAAIQAALP